VRFDLLPPGDFEITVQKAGYVDSSKGAKPKTVHLMPGAVTETVLADLTPLGAIEGTVLDEAGEPLPAVSVHLAGITHVSSYDGHYSFEDLVPGSYPVAVGVPHSVRASHLVRDPATGDYYGYAPAQFYPDADDARLAIPVVVPPGARVRNLDFRLRRTLLVEFTGHLDDVANHEPLTVATVRLSSPIEGPRDPLWTRAAGADGTFRFSLIQPGAYTLTVFRSGITPLPYVIPIQVGKAGVDDLAIPVPAFPNIRGAIHFGDPQARWIGSAAIRVKHSSGVSVNCETKPDGTFEFENVPPGDYQFDVQARNLRLRPDIQRRVSASAVRFGGQNALRRTVAIAESGNPPIEVQFTDEPAGIRGSVVDSSATQGSKYLVYVDGVEAKRSNLNLMIASPDFQFPDVAPGEYEVTAIRAPNSNQAIASAALGTSRSCEESRRVTVREGTVSTISVRPCQ